MWYRYFCFIGKTAFGDLLNEKGPHGGGRKNGTVVKLEDIKTFCSPIVIIVIESKLAQSGDPETDWFIQAITDAINKFMQSFGGSLTNEETWKLAGISKKRFINISRNSSVDFNL